MVCYVYDISHKQDYESTSYRELTARKSIADLRVLIKRHNDYKDSNDNPIYLLNHPYLVGGLRSQPFIFP